MPQPLNNNQHHQHAAPKKMREMFYWCTNSSCERKCWRFSTEFFAFFRLHSKCLLKLFCPFKTLVALNIFAPNFSTDSFIKNRWIGINVSDKTYLQKIRFAGSLTNGKTTNPLMRFNLCVQILSLRWLFNESQLNFTKKERELEKQTDRQKKK